MIVLLLLWAVDLETKRAGDVAAQLRVIVPDEGVAPGLARVRLEITLRGPESMEIDGPRLEDAFAAWRAPIVSSAWTDEGVTRSVLLEQRKPGAAPLPGVVLRVRSSPGEGWRELSWPDPLHEPRNVSPIETTQPLPDGVWWPWAAGAVVLVLLAALLGRRRIAAAVPVDPATEAFTTMHSGSPDDVERALRHYIARRFAVPAHAATPGELLAALRDQLGEAAALLEEALKRCEAARFGPVPVDLDVADPARRFVEATRGDGTSVEERKEG
jgi:hypothetical protein